MVAKIFYILIWWWLEECIGEGNGTPHQYSCLENPMDGGAWWAAVYGVARSPTQLSNFTFTFHFHALEKEMATHSSVLAWRIPGTGEPGGLPSMGSHRVGHNWSDLAAAAAAESWRNICFPPCKSPGSIGVYSFRKSVNRAIDTVTKIRSVSDYRNAVKFKVITTCTPQGHICGGPWPLSTHTRAAAWRNTTEGT